MLKKIEYWVVLFLGILIGSYGCILLSKYTYLTLSNTINIELNPLDIFSLIITVILAVYVTRTLSKKNELEKSEKDLLINYLENFKKLLMSKTAKILEHESFQSLSTNSDFKILRKQLDSILNLAYDYKFVEQNDITSNDLKEKVTDIWQLFTNTPAKVNSSTNTSVKEGIDRLRLEQVNKIEMSLIEIEKLIFQLTMKINNK